MPNKAELTKMLLDKGFKEADFDGLSNRKMEELLKTEPKVEEPAKPEVTKPETVETKDVVEDTPPEPEQPPVPEKPPVPEAPKVSAPKVEAPPKVATKPEPVVEWEKVRVIDNFTDLYIGGEYYSGKKKEFEEYPKNVARILRETGLAV